MDSLTILVPQGAEFQAVQRGIRQLPSVVLRAIPVGIQPVTDWLQRWQGKAEFDDETRFGLIIMGLCGSLTPDVGVGNAVLYESCMDLAQVELPCAVHPRLAHLALPKVRGLSADRVIWSAAEKRQIAKGAAVVDMEGIAVLRFCQPLGIPVTMLRVVSDGATEDLPQLAGAIDAAGNLQPLPLALGLLREPIAALRLIRGALRGLQVLQTYAGEIANQPQSS
jgi:Phosphorylase superfamily